MKKQNTLFYVFILCHILCFYTHYIQSYCIFLENNKININHCLRENLCLIPGIGKKTAQKIYKYRFANGPFHTRSDLQKVMSKKSLREAFSYICFD
ncbi:ComEA family DNA-binding protein [Candidatus Uabimicrobium sp. HlEnr_7]|uniref:ComEA family DNA-binding protein n=1 Tax=Candidatus Uabimicrobium helgolandensis TaxID=3095367 RepID=UPI0035574E6B